MFTLKATLLNDYLKACKSTSRAVAKCISRCVILSRLECRAVAIYTEDRAYGIYIEYVWDKLPEYVKADSNLSSLRRALQSAWRTHIDDPAPKIKDYSKCREAIC